MTSFLKPFLDELLKDDLKILVKESLTTSKDIILVQKKYRQQYIEAKHFCESICGNIYYPSTLAENHEVEDVLNDKYPRSDFFTEDVWIRVVYNETEGEWKDPDNIETHIDYNFNVERRTFPSWKSTSMRHVAMDSPHGKWVSRDGTISLSQYVLCELPKATSIQHNILNEFNTTSPSKTELITVTQL